MGSAVATDNALSRAAGLRFFSTPTQAFSAFKASRSEDILSTR